MFRSPIVDAIVVVVIVLLIFGPKRLPELGKGLGRGMREFKEGISSDHKDDDDQKPAITSAAPVSDPTATTRNESTSEVGSERNS